jgi:hypothetical protein
MLIFRDLQQRGLKAAVSPREVPLDSRGFAA